MLDGNREESNFGRNANAPTRTAAITHHETADRPGSSDATVPWCFSPPAEWLGLTNAYPTCVHRHDAVQ